MNRPGSGRARTRDNTLLRDRDGRAEQTDRDPSDPDYRRRPEDEVTDTVRFMEDRGVRLIHRDEDNAALDLERQHFATRWVAARSFGVAPTSPRATTGSPRLDENEDNGRI